MSSNVITTLPQVVVSHIAAVNAFDTEGIVATFADDAYVNDNRREMWGKDAITQVHCEGIRRRPSRRLDGLILRDASARRQTRRTQKFG